MFFIDGGYIREELKRLFFNDDLNFLAFIQLIKEELTDNFFLEVIRTYYYDGNPDKDDPFYDQKKLYPQNVQGIIVSNSGHWIAEELPVFLVKLLNNFFSGNSTKTSK